LATDCKALVGQVDVDLDQLAIPGRVRRADDRHDHLAIVWGDGGVMCARPSRYHRHDLAVSRADYRDVAGSRSGHERVPLIRRELHHVWNAHSARAEIDASGLAERRVEDVDDVGSLVHRPDLIVAERGGA
jgi:hypothetical protein